MEDLPRQKLRELIASHGQGLSTDKRRCEALLRDVCGSYKREVNLIVMALQEGVATELLGSHQDMPTAVVHARLVQRLRDDRGMAEDAAQWAVETWAFGLGLRATPLPAKIMKPAAVAEIKATTPSAPPPSSTAKARESRPPKQPSAADYLKRGNDYFNNGDADRAIVEFDQALKLDPTYANAFYNRGLAYRRKGNTEHAMKEYNEAIRLDPDYAEVYFSRGNIFLDKGDYDHAIAEYDRAIRLRPKDPAMYNNRGLAHVGKGNFDRAIKDYEQALQLDPKYTKAADNLATAKKQSLWMSIVGFAVLIGLIAWGLKACGAI